MSWIDDVTSPLTDLGLDAGTETAMTDGPGAGSASTEWLAGSGTAMSGGSEVAML